LIDVLVDDRFMLAKKDLTLQFRGSSNQRIINVPASLKAGRVVLWDRLLK
jgi:anaerobic ribonucleoside-triphosphate reductase activating protein